MKRKYGCGRIFRALIGLLAVVLLTGCASNEDARTRLRESDGHYKEGVSFLETDQQRAFVAFQKAIALNPDNFDAHYALGSIYFKRKEFIEAEREFRAAAELNPNDGETLNYLGRSLMLQGRRPEAIEVLKKVTTLPLYMKQGDIPKAQSALSQAKALDPDGTVGTEAARLIHRLDDFHRREVK